MTEGAINARYAVHHHGAWVDELIKKVRSIKKKLNKQIKGDSCKGSWGCYRTFVIESHIK